MSAYNRALLLADLGQMHYGAARFDETLNLLNEALEILRAGGRRRVCRHEPNYISGHRSKGSLGGKSHRLAIGIDSEPSIDEPTRNSHSGNENLFIVFILHHGF